VDSPKTGERWVPIFPDLRPYLEAAFEEAPSGAVHLIRRYRTSNVNLRTQFERIIRRAGETPWPKLFHNLRASCQTDLAERFPIHAVCYWLGNSAIIAQRHYLQVRDEDFDRAAQAPVEAARKPARQQTEWKETIVNGGTGMFAELPCFPDDSATC
jgi:hypothetical protein